MQDIRSRVCVLLFLALASAAASADDTCRDQIASGARIYNQTCVACHGSQGKGLLPGMPDFTSTDGGLNQPIEVLRERITDGYSSGRVPMAMPAKGGNPDLTEQDVDNVILYMRDAFLASKANVCRK